MKLIIISLIFLKSNSEWKKGSGSFLSFSGLFWGYSSRCLSRLCTTYCWGCDQGEWLSCMWGNRYRLRQRAPGDWIGQPTITGWTDSWEDLGATTPGKLQLRMLSKNKGGEQTWWVAVDGSLLCAETFRCTARNEKLAYMSIFFSFMKEAGRSTAIAFRMYREPTQVIIACCSAKLTAIYSLRFKL